MARKWAKFPHPDKRHVYEGAALAKAWPRLHRGDCEPLPKSAGAQAAWSAFHAGDFPHAVETGNAAGGSGVNAAIKAQAIYATYLEKNAAAKLALFEEAAQWADARRQAAPKDANAHYLHAYALGRYGQHISVAKALAQGFGGRIKDALATALALQPKHADAHAAFGAYQAEVIAKVGALVGGLTYGAKKDSAIEHFEIARKLFPESAVERIEYANGLLLLFGKSRIGDAQKLYEDAAAAVPADAMERLDVERARAELE